METKLVAAGNCEKGMREKRVWLHRATGGTLLGMDKELDRTDVRVLAVTPNYGYAWCDPARELGQPYKGEVSVLPFHVTQQRSQNTKFKTKQTNKK